MYITCDITDVLQFIINMNAITTTTTTNPKYNKSSDDEDGSHHGERLLACTYLVNECLFGKNYIIENSSFYACMYDTQYLHTKSRHLFYFLYTRRVHLVFFLYFFVPTLTRQVTLFWLVFFVDATSSSQNIMK